MAAIYERNLNEDWFLHLEAPARTIPTKVPCSVLNDLVSAHMIEDPYYRDNELKALPLMERDYTYTRLIDVSQDLLDRGRILLHFEGIDTLADLYMNGILFGTADNMHRIWEYDVKELLHEGGNELRVTLHSPTRFIRSEYSRDPVEGTSDAMRGFPHIRKAHYMFGWDWGPRLPDMGIFRDVKLIAYDTARIDSVYIKQVHSEDSVALHFDITMESVTGDLVETSRAEIDPVLRLTAVLTDPAGSKREISAPELREGIVISGPKLWWPHGYGAQPLYTVEVILSAAAGEAAPVTGPPITAPGCDRAGRPAGPGCDRGLEILDSRTLRIGLRTMTVHREKDEWGEQFCHEVNGVRIFAMGADYVPEDNLLPRITAERTRRLLEQAVAANHNCIRVWGGGFYPSDAFYDACDELGLLVWQDFMFACAVYHLTPEFEAGIRAEIRDNIRRIRHHASLGLLCGNNEMEMFVLQGEWVTRPSERTDYVRMYEHIIPRLVSKYSPATFYWPASPSSGGHFDEPNSEDRGDAHYWDVWHGGKPFTEYRKHYFRYLSEFGFQSFPSIRTCESFTMPEDRNIFSYVMEKHQRNAGANGKIMNYLEQTFLYPTSFDALLYASQLLQAEAIRYGIEHFRRNRGRCMGTVVWQLNDCWPVASWSSIDYCGRWKALHYAEKRAFAPVLLSCEESGILTQDPNPNAELLVTPGENGKADLCVDSGQQLGAEPAALCKAFRLNLSNETREAVRATVRWELRDPYARVIRGGVFENVPVPALSAVWLEEVDCADALYRENYVSYSCELLDSFSCDSCLAAADGQPRAPITGPGCDRDSTDSADHSPGLRSEVYSSGSALFVPPKQFRFADPHLRVRASGDEIVVEADAYARAVKISNTRDDLVLSDNYFDMNAGTVRVRLLRGTPDGLKVRSVYDIR